MKSETPSPYPSAVPFTSEHEVLLSAISQRYKEALDHGDVAMAAEIDVAFQYTEFNTRRCYELLDDLVEFGKVEVLPWGILKPTGN